MAKQQTLSFRDYIRISVWSFKINWNISPFITISSVITSTYFKLQGVVNTYVIARIVDKLIEVVSNGRGDISDILPWVIFIAIFDLLSAVFGALRNYTNRCRRRFAPPYLREMKFLKIYT